MNNKSFARFLSTFGPIGYLPAPGTLATIVTLPFAWMLHSWMPLWQMHIAFITALFFFAVVLIHISLPFFSNQKDPSEIVIDEAIGCLIVFVGQPMNWVTLFFGFLLFRVFDIYKWFGISRLERIAGPWGIMLDDVAAGILANVLLHGMWWLIHYTLDLFIIWL